MSRPIRIKQETNCESPTKFIDSMDVPLTSEMNGDSPKKVIESVSKFLDPAKQLLQWLYETKSKRFTLKNNPKGKNRFVWRQFRLAYVDDIEQPYAMCCQCQAFVKYSGRTGTGGLVRHNCFRQNIASIDYHDQRKEHEQKKSLLPSIGRLEIEELMHVNSSRIGFIPNFKGKSGVWTLFDIITVDNNPVNFAACKLCRGIVSYISRTGTGSMTRHKCPRKKRIASPDPIAVDLAKRVKIEEPEELVESRSPPAGSLEQSPEPNIADLHLKAFSQMLQVNLQNFGEKPESQPSPEPREPPENSLRRQYMEMMRRSLDMFHALRNDVFFDLAQTFVNIGAEYGKIDIRQVLLHSTDLNDIFDSGDI